MERVHGVRRGGVTASLRAFRQRQDQADRRALAAALPLDRPPKPASGVRWQEARVERQVHRIQRDAARLDGEHGQIVAGLAQAKGKIAEIELQVIQINQDPRNEMNTELREIQAKEGPLSPSCS